MWETKKLGDVCETGAGGTPLKSKKEYYDSGTIPWLLSGEVSQRDIRRAKCFISDAGLKNSSAKLFPVNTVLVAMYGATAGQVGILRFEACTNQAVCGILPNQQTIPEFIYYTFLLKKNELVATASGNAQPNISQTKIKNTLIPLPPLPEQRRIVGILDEAFAGIDKIIANTEQNLSNARELFESYLNNAFTQKADGWVTEVLNANVKFLDYRGKTPPKTKAGIRLITAKNVKMGFINRYPEEFIDANVYDEWMTRGFPQEGDVLFTTEAPLGNVAQLDTSETVVIGQRLITMQPAPEVLDRTFLKYLLMSKPLQDEIFARGTGATVLGIKAKLLKSIPIFYPQYIEQRKIALEIKELESEVKRLEVLYQQKLDALNELKQSILQRAFSGDLPASAPADTT